MKNFTNRNDKLNYLSFVLAATLFVGCGSSSSGTPKNSGTGDIDLANYFPKSDITKTFTTVEGNTTDFTSGSYEDVISVVENNTTKTITTVNTSEVTTITDKNITIVDGNDTYSNFRHVNIGDTFYSLKNTESQDVKKDNINYATITNKVNIECNIDETLEEFIKGEHKYTGDILKVKCINNGKITIAINPTIIALAPERFKDINGTHDNYDIFNLYFKKDIGQISEIDDDCVVVSDEVKIVDDRKSTCVEKRYSYDFYVEK